jgi:hypothetical protein
VIIGLVGFIGCGKGTVADLLVENYGFHKESFANSVKDAVSVIFGWDRNLLEGDTIHSRKWREQPDDWWSRKMGRPFSPREALQLMGTEAGRKVFHEDLWLYSVERRINPDKNYVIADVRFPNEIKMITDLGGRVIRVTRGPDPEWYSLAHSINMGKATEKYPEVHFSEWAWIGDSNITMTIDNNCALHELPKRVDMMIDWVYNSHVESNEDINNEIV